MIKCFYDLHIHSALSPCASCDMTIHNIINMAKLKELDMISLTDHNSAKNTEVFVKVAKKHDLLVIPGIEVETYEGIHMLCYFQTVDDLLVFDQIVYQNVPRIQNNEALCGEQLIFHEDDEVRCKEVKMLMNSTKLKLHELVKLVHLCHGIIFAAHVDRYANSILTVLGFIPEHIEIDGVEFSMNQSKDKLKLGKYRIIQNSDAHYLGQICEKMNYLELEEKSIEAFFTYFREAI